MQALQLESPRHWRMIDVPEPKAPGPGEALLRILTVGVCGTDIGGYLGKMPFFSYPRIPGHELGVEVVSIGEGVTNLKPGDRCSIEPYLNCQTCYACKRGFTNCCEQNQTLGVMCDGGLTDYIILPARKCHPANSLTSEQCALVETLAIGCHAVDRGAAKPGENILIIGAGPIGLSAVEFARLAGARVIVADLNPHRLAFVRETMGIPDTLQIAGDDTDFEKLSEMTNGQLADLVVDATGHNVSMIRSMAFCAFAGRLVYVGITQSDLSFPQAPFLHRRELSILGSRNAPSRDFPRIINLIAEGKIDTTPWVTRRMAFADVPGEFESLLAPEIHSVKTMITLP